VMACAQRVPSRTCAACTARLGQLGPPAVARLLEHVQQQPQPVAPGGRGQRAEGVPHQRSHLRGSLEAAWPHRRLQLKDAKHAASFGRGGRAASAQPPAAQKP